MKPAEDIDAIVRGFLAQQARAAADQSRPLRRGTHAKGICVRARFDVPDLAGAGDAELAARLAVGVFARPGVYPAVARFANSDPTVNSDWQRDVRGLSFSVDLSASGQVPPLRGEDAVGTSTGRVVRDTSGSPHAALPAEPGGAPPTQRIRQDWSLQSAPTLPFDDTRAFAVFGRVLAARNEAVGLAAASPDDRLLFARTKAAVVQQQRQQVVRPYQKLRYWSNVPFRYGSRDIVKYSASPRPANPARPLVIGNPQALRDELLRHLNDDENMSVFDVSVQFLDVGRMRFERTPRDAAFWVENASVEWPEDEAPFHTVATLTLERGGALADDECEGMFIDVNACSLPEHEPVGRLNVARRAAEAASRRARGVGTDGFRSGSAGTAGAGPP